MGLLGGLGKLVGKGIKAVKGVALPALIPGGAIASKIAGRIGRIGVKKAVAGGAVAGLGAAAIMGHMGAGGTQARLAGGMTGRRRRRINPGNPSAMRRAVRRVEAGAKMYHKLFGITHKSIHGAPGVHIKRHRRAA